MTTTNRAAAFIDSVGWAGLASSYYTECPREPAIKPAEILPIGAPHKLSPMTVKDLLDAIVKHAKKGEHILIACHGTDSGPALALGGGYNLEEPGGLAMLERYEGGKLSANDIANEFGWSLDQLNQFSARLGEVRALQLDRVEIRACNTGAKVKVLKSLKNFFGCKRMCAPKNLTFYTPINSPVNKLTYEKTRKPLLARGRETGKKPDRFALETTIINLGLDIKVRALAESEKAVSDWMTSHLPGSHTWNKNIFHAEAIQIKGNRVAWAGENRFRALLTAV